MNTYTSSFPAHSKLENLFDIVIGSYRIVAKLDILQQPVVCYTITIGASSREFISAIIGKDGTSRWQFSSKVTQFQSRKDMEALHEVQNRLYEMTDEIFRLCQG